MNKDPETQKVRMIFYKCDTRTYVPFKSCYPKYRKKDIHFTLARRICATVENINMRQKRSKGLENARIRSRKNAYKISYISNK